MPVGLQGRRSNGVISKFDGPDVKCIPSRDVGLTPDVDEIGRNDKVYDRVLQPVGDQLRARLRRKKVTQYNESIKIHSPG